MGAIEREKRREFLCDKIEKLEDIVSRLKECYSELEELELFDLEDAERALEELNEQVSCIDDEDYKDFCREMEIWIHTA